MPVVEEPPDQDPASAPDSEQAAPQDTPSDVDTGPCDLWPWSLAGLAPEVAKAAGAGVPAMIFWRFQLPERPLG